MLDGRGLRYRIVLGAVIGATIAFPLGAFAAKAFLTRKPSPPAREAASPSTNPTSNPFLTEGFDFDQLRKSENEWRGPNVGEKIDLTRLRMKNREPLASLIGKRPIMLVSVSPECAMCRIARDEMIHLNKKLSGMQINYYLASFAAQPHASDFFEYAASLKVGAQGFLWNAEGGPPPEALFTMTTPSHILLNHDGTVIRVWPGSYDDIHVRQRMARQILADTAVIIDTISAVLPEDVGTRP
jgi:hypothetical protein